MSQRAVVYDEITAYYSGQVRIRERFCEGYHAMARIQFNYGWYDEAHTVMSYTALPGWNWKDYHAVVRVSLMSMLTHSQPVHTLIDLSANVPFPGGLAAHARTFGKPLNPYISGQVVVVGVPLSQLERLGVATSRELRTPHGQVHFVDTLADVRLYFSV